LLQRSLIIDKTVNQRDHDGPEIDGKKENVNKIKLYLRKNNL